MSKLHSSSMIEWIKDVLIRSRHVSPDKILKYPEGKRIYSDFHSIRKGYIDPDALKVIGRLQKFGYRAYIVGGCVRDLLLQRTPKDYDIVTNAFPHEIRKIFGNSRIIGKRFRLVHIVFRGNKIIEVSTARSLPASRRMGGHKSDELYLEKDNQFGTFKEDAARRDFTINALFFDVRNEVLIDYSGGMEDIENKIIRVVGNENISFPEDPVRMLRAIKFKSLLSFQFQPELIRAIKKHKKLISKASTARLHEEFNKIFRTGQSFQVFRDMARYELLETMLPEISVKQKENYPHWPDDFAETILGRSLTIADRMISEHEDMNITLYYAILCADLVTNFFTSSLSGKKIVEEITVVLEKPFLELGLSKKEKERLIEIFSCQSRFGQEATTRHKGWVKSFKAKEYFLEAFIFYKIHARANKNDEAVQKALFWEIGLRKKLPQAIYKNSVRPLVMDKDSQAKNPNSKARGSSGNQRNFMSEAEKANQTSKNELASRKQNFQPRQEDSSIDTKEQAANATGNNRSGKKQTHSTAAAKTSSDLRQNSGRKKRSYPRKKSFRSQEKNQKPRQEGEQESGNANS